MHSPKEMLAVLFKGMELNEKVSMYRDVKQKTLSFVNLKHRDGITGRLMIPN